MDKVEKKLIERVKDLEKKQELLIKFLGEMGVVFDDEFESFIKEQETEEQ